jgi:hypothetical protein
MKAQEDVGRESFDVEGGQLLDKVKQVIHEGNVRRIIIRQDDRTVAEFPLTVGVVGVVVAPVFAAIGALAALIAKCTIEVERAEEKAPEQPPEGAAGSETPPPPAA